MSGRGALPGLPKWTTGLSLKRQRELLAVLDKERHRFHSALINHAESVKKKVLSEQPEGAFRDCYNKGYMTALEDVFALKFPGLARGGGHRSYAIDGHSLRESESGYIGLAP